MGYYDDPDNVQQYIEMAEGYDGRELVEALARHLPPGSTVLELGMGTGKDLDLLNRTFRATGSDNAQPFLDLYRERHPQADLLLLDAITMEAAIDAGRTFDAIYSNKVLYHLTREEMRSSLRQQARVLNPGGLLLHSLWYGDGEEEMHGLYFAYYTEDTFFEWVAGDGLGAELAVIETSRYTEMEPDDSFYVVLRKK
jgi:SAM-dependent methyltransferase